jgi:hypothetical protein
LPLTLSGGFAPSPNLVLRKTRERLPWVPVPKTLGQGENAPVAFSR